MAELDENSVLPDDPNYDDPYAGLSEAEIAAYNALLGIETSEQPELVRSANPPRFALPPIEYLYAVSAEKAAVAQNAFDQASPIYEPTIDGDSRTLREDAEIIVDKALEKYSNQPLPDHEGGNTLEGVDRDSLVVAVAATVSWIVGGNSSWANRMREIKRGEIEGREVADLILEVATSGRREDLIQVINKSTMTIGNADEADIRNVAASWGEDARFVGRVSEAYEQIDPYPNQLLRVIFPQENFFERVRRNEGVDIELKKVTVAPDPEDEYGSIETILEVPEDDQITHYYANNELVPALVELVHKFTRIAPPKGFIASHLGSNLSGFKGTIFGLIALNEMLALRDEPSRHDLLKRLDLPEDLRDLPVDFIMEIFKAIRTKDLDTLEARGDEFGIPRTGVPITVENFDEDTVRHLAIKAKNEVIENAIKLRNLSGPARRSQGE